MFFLAMSEKNSLMKNILKVLLIAAVMGTFSGCSSDELIEPSTISEDLRTSANLYQDQFLTFNITATEMGTRLTFFLSGNGGRVSVNWGDGTIEKKYVTSRIRLEHEYGNMKNYTVNVSGDIKTITELELNYADMVFNKIHFGGLTNLKYLNFNLFAAGPITVNLSRNRMLEHITLLGIERMEDVILPSTNKISSLDISGDNNLSTAAVDRIVARIHDSVVNSPRAGFITLRATWYQEEGDNAMVGPPSSYTINKLKKLRDVYGWNVNPEIE
jgi:hypothetical protein